MIDSGAIHSSTISVVVLSCVFMVCLTTVVFACGVCRKIFKKKGKKKETENKVEVPEIELTENGDCEKGIANPVYEINSAQNTEHNNGGTAIKKENEVQIEDEIINDNNGNDVKEVSVQEEITPVQESVEESAAVVQESAPVAADANVSDGSLHGKQLEEDEKDEQKEEEGRKEEYYLEEGVHNNAFESNEAMADDTNENPSSETASKSSESDEDNTFESYDGLLVQGGWRRKVLLRDLLEIGLIDKASVDEAIDELRLRREELIKKQQEVGDDEDDVTLDPDEDDYVPMKLRPLLCGEEPVAGIIVSESGEKKSIYRSAKEGLLRRGTAISMLEAQAATGNIIDPITGRKMSVKHATQLGLLDKVYETVLTRAERAVTGYKTRASDDILSVFEAMQKGLVVESHGLRLLEAQYSTGGLIDHRINARLSGEKAIERNIINEELNKKLEKQDSAETGTFFDPNTEESITYKELMRRSVLDTDTGLRLYPLENIGRKRYSYGSYSGRSSLASSRSLSRASSRESIPSAVSSGN